MSANRFSIVLGALLVLLLAGIGVAPAQPGPLRIGFVTDLTGPAAQAAKDMVNGLTLYPDEIGSQIAGPKVELIVADSHGRPDVALSNLRNTRQHDRGAIAAGGASAHVGYA